MRLLREEAFGILSASGVDIPLTAPRHISPALQLSHLRCTISCLGYCTSCSCSHVPIARALGCFGPESSHAPAVPRYTCMH